MLTSQCASRKTRTSPEAASAPASRARIKPRRSVDRTIFTMLSGHDFWIISSSSAPTSAVTHHRHHHTICCMLQYHSNQNCTTAIRYKEKFLNMADIYQTRNSARLTDQRCSYVFSCSRFSIHYLVIFQ